MKINTEVLRICNQLEAETLKAFNKTGSIRKAARLLGVTKSTVHRRLNNIKNKAEEQNINTSTNTTNNLFVKSVSTIYNGDGSVKTKRITSNRVVEAKFEHFKLALEDVLENYKGTSVLIKKPDYSIKNLLSVYPIPDAHIGMLSWARETGYPYNLDIAEKELLSTFDKLVSRSPASSKALIISLGDLFHTDNSTNMTLASGNILDVDSRYPKMIAVGIKLLRHVIDRSLQKHDHVTVWIRQGNHDTHSSIMTAIAMDAIYDNNPRVTVSTEPGQFDTLKHGKCLIGGTHGHTIGMAKLPGIMAERYREDWGNTKFGYWYTGHVHHDEIHEFPGCVVEKLRAVCPKDAYAHSAGFDSGRDMKCDIWDEEDGKISRFIQRVRDYS